MNKISDLAETLLTSMQEWRIQEVGKPGDKVRALLMPNTNPSVQGQIEQERADPRKQLMWQFENKQEAVALWMSFVLQDVLDKHGLSYENDLGINGQHHGSAPCSSS